METPVNDNTKYIPVNEQVRLYFQSAHYTEKHLKLTNQLLAILMGIVK